jgi:hypothetical protein
VEAFVWTGVGRRESARSEVSDLDEEHRRTFDEAMSSLTSCSYGDTVRVVDAANGETSAHPGRTGTVRGFPRVNATLQIWLADGSAIDVPVTQGELVTPYTTPHEN